MQLYTDINVCETVKLQNENENEMQVNDEPRLQLNEKILCQLFIKQNQQLMKHNILKTQNSNHK